jgi:organic radical activating enzyme
MTYSAAVKSSLYLRLIRNNFRLMIPNERTINYVRYKVGKKSREVNLDKVAPVFVTYFVTNRCNLTCSFCMVGNVLNPKDWRDREATVDKTARLFEQPVAKRALYVMLSGGEPTINKEIVPIIKLLKRQGRMVAMTTNGHYLDRKADEMIAARLDSINVSLYPDNFDKVREILPAIAPRLHTKVCKVILRPMLDNPEEIEAAAELTQSAGSSGLYLANVFPSSNAPTSPESNIIYDTDAPLYEQVKQRIQKKFPRLSINWPAPASKASPPQKRCRMPWYFITFDALGNMGMCCNSANCTQGNIFSLAPLEVMNTTDWTAVRDGILSKGPVAPMCKDCYLMNDPYGSDV